MSHLCGFRRRSFPGPIAGYGLVVFLVCGELIVPLQAPPVRVPLSHLGICSLSRRHDLLLFFLELGGGVVDTSLLCTWDAQHVISLHLKRGTGGGETFYNLAACGRAHIKAKRCPRGERCASHLICRLRYTIKGDSAEGMQVSRTPP